MPLFSKSLARCGTLDCSTGGELVVCKLYRLLAISSLLESARGSQSRFQEPLAKTACISNQAMSAKSVNIKKISICLLQPVPGTGTWEITICIRRIAPLNVLKNPTLSLKRGGVLGLRNFLPLNYKQVAHQLEQTSALSTSLLRRIWPETQAVTDAADMFLGFASTSSGGTWAWDCHNPRPLYRSLLQCDGVISCR